MTYDPAPCADVSRNQWADPVPGHGPTAHLYPCRYCGHPACLPGQPCQFCRIEQRLTALENPAKEPTT